MAVEAQPEGTAEPAGLERVLDLMADEHLGTAPEDEICRAMELMVMHVDFPCLGAKSVFRRESVTHLVLDDMDDPSTPRVLLERLTEFAEQTSQSDDFRSFMVTFRGPVPAGEADFETRLYRILQGMHDADEEPWAPGVATDPTDPHFAFSAGGHAYFIVGMHPAASRVARRAPLPTLVFNAHDQFERLREEGRFEGMRETIRRRDEELQGSVNPMAADHGETSEALQYSGRRHDPDWEPPLEISDEVAPDLREETDG